MAFKEEEIESCPKNIAAFLNATERLDEERNSRVARAALRSACSLRPFTRGGNGVVYRVKDGDGKEYVLKFATAESREEIIDEFDIGRRAGDAGPTMHAVEAVQLEEYVALGAILMEAFDGSLTDIFKRIERSYGILKRERLRLLEAAIEEQVPLLIDQVTGKGLVCIDMKPANVLYRLLEPERRARAPPPYVLKLTDWGSDFCAEGGPLALRRLFMATLFSSSMKQFYEQIRDEEGPEGLRCKLPGCFLRDYMKKQLAELRQMGLAEANDIADAMRAIQVKYSSAPKEYGRFAIYYAKDSSEFAPGGAKSKGEYIDAGVRFLKLFVDGLAEEEAPAAEGVSV